jgi:tetratricopeptide (TPR) repeat protein
MSSTTPLGADLAAVMQMASLRCEQRRCEDAISLLEKANRIQPANPAIYFHLGFCHAGGCMQHSLINLDMAAAYLRRALLLVGTAADPLLRAKVLSALGNVCSQPGADAVPLRQAIAYHQEAAEIYARIGQTNEWAREEFNQAGVWCDLPETQFPDKWTQASEHYENALTIRTRTHDPQAYASTMMNLGTALRQLRSGDKQQNVLKAVRCYRQALRIHKLQTSPRQFAELCNNLGNACMTCPGRDETCATRHTRYAIRHFERALQVWSSRQYAYYHALAQYNLGCARLRLLTSTQCLEQAITCFAAAVDCGKSCGYTEIEQLARARLQALVSDITKLHKSCTTSVSQSTGGQP